MRAPPIGPYDLPILKDVREVEVVSAEIRKFYRDFRKSLLFESPSHLSSDSAARALEGGRFLLRASAYRLPTKECQEVASALLELLRRHLPGRKDALDRIQESFARDEIPPQDFIAQALGDRSEEIAVASRRLGVDEDTLTFIAVFLARPFRAQAAQELTRGVDVGSWLRGYCPVCGHWPALAHIQSDDGHRTLWCLHCGTYWPFGRLQCPYCLNEDQETLELIGTEEEPSFRVHGCASCRTYIKEIRSDQPTGMFPFDMFYLGTHALDLLARRAGFTAQRLLEVADVDAEGEGK